MEVAGNTKNARRYYEGSVKFMNSLVQVLEALTSRVSQLALEDHYNANISQIYGVCLLTFVMVLSPILLVLARNGITSIQVSEENLEKIDCNARKKDAFFKNRYQLAF